MHYSLRHNMRRTCSHANRDCMKPGWNPSPTRQSLDPCAQFCAFLYFIHTTYPLAHIHVMRDEGVFFSEVVNIIYSSSIQIIFQVIVHFKLALCNI